LKGKEPKRTSNSHWGVANPTIAPGNETAAANGRSFPLSFKKTGEKNQKGLQSVSFATPQKERLPLGCRRSFSGTVVPQFEVLCQAFFQESGTILVYPILPQK
jgi:hypothetical protein